MVYVTLNCSLAIFPGKPRQENNNRVQYPVQNHHYLRPTKKYTKY